MRSRSAAIFRVTFASLMVPNYRLYFIGQAVSVSGTFMQAVAQAWLVLKLTGSGTALGMVTALQYAPLLVLGPWGGVLVDRYDKRTILYLTQAAFGLQAFILAILVLTNTVALWMVGVLALMFGLITAVDYPARHAFVPEMVGSDLIRNAVTLNSTLVNLARVLGPVIAAAFIINVGLGACFLTNSFSYAVIILLLSRINPSRLNRNTPAKSQGGNLTDGLRYIIRTPIIRNTLLMMAVIGTLTYEFQVSLPLLAEFTFHGDAATYAALTSAQGIGSIIGGLLLAGRKTVSSRSLVSTAYLFGACTLLAAFMPNLSLTMLMIGGVGFFSITFLTLGNTILQLGSDQRMRGRVMSYWSMAFLGSTAIGGPVIGWIGQNLSPRWGLGTGGVAAIAAATAGMIAIRKFRKTTTPETEHIAISAAIREPRVL